MFANLIDWYFNLLEIPEFWYGVIIWTLLITPFEMLIHELGHYYFQRKYGIKIRFFRIGMGKLIRWKTKNGLRVFLGVPLFTAESRSLGEGKDWDRKKYKPTSFSYIHRHPADRLIIAVAGPLASTWIFTAIYAVWYLIATMVGSEVPLWTKTIFWLVYATEMMNLCVPIWFSKDYKTDSWIALASLWQWLRWKQCNNKPKTPRN